MKLGDIARLEGMKPSRCWKKVKYRSEGAAKAHLRALLRSEGVHGEDRLNAYKCECGSWHVGHVGKTIQ